MYQHKRWWGLPRRGKTVSRTLKCTYCCGVPFEFLLSFSTKEFLALGQNLKIHVLRGHKKPSEAELENSCFTGRGVGSHGVGWQRSGRVHDASAEAERRRGREGRKGNVVIPKRSLICISAYWDVGGYSTSSNSELR
jgi:hypothetical protein